MLRRQCKPVKWGAEGELGVLGAEVVCAKENVQKV